MANNAKQNAQLKGRQTKLNKKSHEELVEIVIRKDKLERNLNHQIVGLKAEVNSLNFRVAAFDKDQEGNIKAIKDWKQKYDNKCDAVRTANERADEAARKADKFEEMYKDTYKKNVELKAQLKSTRNLTWVLAGFTLICLLGWILG